VTFSKTYLSALLVIAALGCSDAGDDDGDDGEDPICQPECVGDEICTSEGCEPAFERDYQIRLFLSRIGEGFEVCPNPNDCWLPYVAVYFNGQEGPILESTRTRLAQIRVNKGSSLGVDFQGDYCTLELTADRLRAGNVTCSSPRVSARLSMVAMPL
jgi:hypothetical protein